MSQPNAEGGFESPEQAAMYGFPEKYCRVVSSRVLGDRAYVLLDTGSPGHPYLYGVNCLRDDGGWGETSSSNGGGWAQTDDDPDLGTLSFWADAPADADAVRVEFEGHQVEEPVREGAFLLVWWKVPCPNWTDWPRVVALRVNGRWEPDTNGGSPR